MSMKKITDSVYAAGVLNPQLRVFDIVMRTEYGTSYNAYLVKGAEKSALVETVHASFFEEYRENLEQVVDIASVDYLIMNHTEPDHSGSIARLAELNPNLTILGTMSAIRFMKAITNRTDLHYQVVKDGDTLDLGGGKVLTFIVAPFLHWPDSMFTYLAAEKLAFTCDFLGAHYCQPTVTDDHIYHPETYWTSMQGYYAAIFGPFPQHVRFGLDKLRALELEWVCPSHGPVLRSRLADVMEYYAAASAEKPAGAKYVPIFYTSAYGYTGKLAQAAAEVLREAGVETEVIDLVTYTGDDLGAKISASTAFMVGSPTINRDATPPLWQLLSHVDAITNRGKSVGVFGSYGWSGEAVPALVARVKSLSLKPVGEGFRANFTPSAEELEGMRDYTRALLETL